MRVSVVIPTFNRASFLVDAIKSALDQDYLDLEVLVSDNCSADYTEEVGLYFQKMDPRVRYFRNSKNIGMVPNWHKAVFEFATGDWFLLLSDDDILVEKDFISQAVEIIKANAQVQLVYSHSYIFDEALYTLNHLKIPFSRVEDGRLVFSKRGTVKPQDFALCNVLFPRALAAQCHAFENPHNLSCDTELFLLLCLRGQVGVVDRIGSLYRIHSGNLLKTAARSPELFIGSLDSLVTPLREARRLGVDRRVVAEFVRNSKLAKEIFVILLKTCSVDKARAKKLYSDLKILLGPDDCDLIPSVRVFKYMLFGAPLWPTLLRARRKALYIYGSLRRKAVSQKVYFELLNRDVYVEQGKEI
jgi:glycosyltransferase involved in cell wall biosynthesis